MGGEALQRIGVYGQWVGHIAREANSQVAAHDEDGGRQDDCQHPNHLSCPGSGREPHTPRSKLCRTAQPHCHSASELRRRNHGSTPKEICAKQSSTGCMGARCCPALGALHAATAESSRHTWVQHCSRRRVAEHQQGLAKKFYWLLKYRKLPQ